MDKGKLYDLLVPKLEEIKSKIQDDLSNAFEVVNVEIVDCPDLTKEPFLLAGKGICGNPTIVDVGSLANLAPEPNFDARFDLNDVVSGSNIPNAYLCGAGIGPFYETGINCELVLDATSEKSKIGVNKSMLAKVEDQKHISFPASSSNYAIMGQYLCCEGISGKVLKISAEKRKKDGSLVTFMQHSLAKHFGSEKKAVGMGGVILLESATIQVHVMPTFSKNPLSSPSKIAEWLNYFQFPAPFIAVGQLVSHDPLNLDLKLEHFHGFTPDRKIAGHFEFDTTPDTVKITGYFVVGEKLFRQNPTTKNKK